MEECLRFAKLAYFDALSISRSKTLGNLISFMVMLAPIPTFYRVYKKKSTEGFQSLAYVASLFSAMLWIYYAFIKTNEYLLIIINTFGCIIQTIYIVTYLTYAPKKAKAIFRLV